TARHAAAVLGSHVVGSRPHRPSPDHHGPALSAIREVPRSLSRRRRPRPPPASVRRARPIARSWGSDMGTSERPLVLRYAPVGRLVVERAMGIDPTTYSLGSCRSTTELRPQQG